MRILLNDQLHHHLDNWDCDEDDEDIIQEDTKRQHDDNDDDDDDDEEPQREDMRPNHQVRKLFAVGKEPFLILSLAVSVVYLPPKLLLSILVSALVYVLLQYARKWLQRKRSDHWHNCRLEIARLLGTIGAPALEEDGGRAKDPPWTGWDCGKEMVVDLARAQVGFLLVTQQLLERLRVATSLQLGLGPWSPSVERVELGESARPQPRIPVGRVKQALATELRQQLQLLAQLLEHDDDDNDNHDDEVAGASVVTLSLLRSLHREATVRLSEVLSILTTGVQVVDPQRLCQAKRQTEIAHANVCSLLETSSPNIALHNHSKLVNEMARQLHASQVTLWALQHSQSQKDQVEWLARLDHAVGASNDLNLRLQQVLSAPDAIAKRDNSKEHIPDSAKSMQEHNPQQEFEDVGSHPFSPPNKGPAPRNSEKTLVFSGEGTVKQQQRHGSSSDSWAGRAGEPRVAATGLLLQELRTRISAMDIAPEVDADGNNVSHDRGALSTETQQRTVSLLPRASNGLLSELMKRVDAGQDEHVIGSE